jgi:hypothetical protein
LLHSAQLGKFRQDCFASQSCHHVRHPANGGIGGDPGKSIGPAALEPDGQCRKRRRFALKTIGLDQPKKCLPDRLREHRRFQLALLLIEDEQRFGRPRIALVQLLLQNRNLRVLATQAQHRGSGHVGMMNVTG